MLDGIDLHVPAGTVFSLLGRNGAGRTTTVQILSTLIGADGGELRVAGHDVARDPDSVRAAIGVTGQFSAVDRLLTGEENLILMADLHHLGRRAGRQRAAELLDQFDLADAGKKVAATCSGGMQRRLDLAMTLVGGPASSGPMRHAGTRSRCGPPGGTMTSMHSLPAFLAVAAVVTLTPGPAYALVLQVAVTRGRRAALATIAGNSVGVLAWGALAAVGVSELLAANRLAYDVLRLVGAAYLIGLGLRALLSGRGGTTGTAPGDGSGPASTARSGSAAWRAGRRGLINSLANPKLAVFFVALFPQFLVPGAAVLPAALAMAGVIVTFDLLWYGSTALAVDRLRRVLQPRLTRRLEKVTGAVLMAFGVRLATEAR